MGTPRTEAPWVWWVAALSYFALISLAHLRFSFWLVRTRPPPFGLEGYWRIADLVPAIALLAVMALTAWVVHGAWRAKRPWPVLSHWLLWLACVIAIDRWLTFSINEVAHYPQYALLAWLLARAMDPQRTRQPIARLLFWTTLLGMIDEAQQYLWLAPAYGEYLDINDFLINLLGGVLGVLLYYGFDPPPRAGGPRRPALLEWSTTSILAVLLAAGFASGHLVLDPPRAFAPGGLHRDDGGALRLYLQRVPDNYGSVKPGPRHGQYHVLHPWSGLILIGGLGLAFARLPHGLWLAPRR